ncbi:MAG: 6-phosphogluconolactonase [Methylophilaceae bacterium]|nr:6-phosphogluconolactonase [Methylophilaceae bacterium]
MTPQICRWHVFPTNTELAQAAVQAILDAARQAIAARGRFDIVLAGGTTPRIVYEMLKDKDADWAYWHVWYGDERCLPPDDPERNSLMASQAWLNHVPIPVSQHHPIPAERGSVEGAAAYSAELAGVGTFDLVLLGMGEDGHTASLFPGHTWDHNPPTPAIPVRHAPKPPPERVSLSASRLSDARQVIFLVTGAGKRNAVQHWKGTGYMPVKAITPAAGVDVYLDATADAQA